MARAQLNRAVHSQHETVQTVRAEQKNLQLYQKSFQIQEKKENEDPERKMELLKKQAMKLRACCRQKCAREALRTTCMSHFAAGIQPWDVGLPRHVGLDAAAAVVLGGDHRNWLLCDVDAVLLTAGCNVGKVMPDGISRLVRDIQQHMGLAPGHHLQPPKALVGFYKTRGDIVAKFGDLIQKGKPIGGSRVSTDESSHFSAIITHCLMLRRLRLV